MVDFSRVTDIARQLSGRSPLPGEPRPDTPIKDIAANLAAQKPGGPEATARDGWARFAKILDDYGLTELMPFLEKMWIDNASEDEVELALRDHPVYKKRFRAIELRKEQGLPPISVDQVLESESRYIELMTRAGMPKGFYDSTDDFVDFLVKDVSPDELGARILRGYTAAQQAPAEVKGQLQELYGLTEGDLAAYYLDPDRLLSTLERQLAAAKISGAGMRTGYGSLQQSQAERLAALDIDERTAQEGFGQLQNQRELFAGLAGHGYSDHITRDEQLAATFGGDAAAKEKIERTAKGRVAEFAGGGGFANGERGYQGLGKAK